MQELEKKVPSSFERLAHRKGFVRYMSPELRQLAGKLTEGKQDLEVALSGLLKVVPFPGIPPPWLCLKWVQTLGRSA